MIIVDTALQAREKESRPIRVALLGAGFTSHGLANHIVNTMPGMRLVGIYNRRSQRAFDLFTYVGLQEFFEELKRRVSPDLIFTHYRDDRHQDHRTISDLTWNTWRNHLILEYEIPKHDGDLGSPNCFVPLGREVCDRKIKYICDVFQTQSNRAWLAEETFQAILRLRGVECAGQVRRGILLSQAGL